jgi:hypothetical protein
MTNSMKEAFEKASKEYVKKEIQRATFKLLTGREPTKKDLRERKLPLKKPLIISFNDPLCPKTFLKGRKDMSEKEVKENYTTVIFPEKDSIK